jgi:hypothetical protein
VTQAGELFWFRLPKDKLTVLGEYHDYKDGNVQDVIRALRTSRFMYEPFNEMAETKALAVPFTGTQTRLEQANKDIGISKFADRTKFDPDLENITIKALTGASIARNEFFSLPVKARDDATWKARASTSDYSMGERVALYLSFGIHIAADLSKHDFGPVNFVESPYVKARPAATRTRPPSRHSRSPSTSTARSTSSSSGPRAGAQTSRSRART